MLREKQFGNFGRKLKISEENQKNQTNFRNFGRKPKISGGKQNKNLRRKEEKLERKLVTSETSYNSFLSEIIYRFFVLHNQYKKQ